MTERPPATRHMDALDAQIDIVRWAKSEVGVGYYDAWAELEQEHSGRERIAGELITPDGKILTLDLAHMVQLACTRSDCYWVSGTMMGLLEGATPTIEPQPLRPTDLPSRSGFVLLDRSISVADWHDRTIGIRAFCWDTIFRQSDLRNGGTESSGIMIYCWADLEDSQSQDSYRDQLNTLRHEYSGMSRWNFCLDHLWTYGTAWELLGYQPHADTVEEYRNLILNEQVGDSMDQRPGSCPMKLDPGQSYFRQFVMALWTLMEQPLIVENGTGPLPRAVRRRAADFGFIPTVRVITLRRIYHKDGHTEREPEEGPWYTHRFMVRGHWRWITDKHGDRRQTWVRPHIKGPNDAPLVLKDTIYRVSR